MSLRKSVLLLTSTFCLLLAFTHVPTADTTPVRLSKAGFIPAQATLKTLAPSSTLISGTLHFKLKNEAELDLLLKEQYDSTSPNYLKWLSPSEFGERFGASRETYKEAINYLKASGITVTQTWANNLRIDFQAPASEIEKAFQTQMQLFELEQKTYYGHTQKVALPLELISEIADIRLNNFLFTQPTLKQQQTEEILPAFTDRGRTAIAPQDFHLAYNFNPLFASGIEGNGQSIAVVARSDFDMSDVTLYRDFFKLPDTTITKVPAGGAIINRGGIETIEVLLDTQLSSAAAPKADVKVVIADQNNDIDQSLAFIINNLPDTKVMSISFGACEKVLFPQFEALFNNLYKQAAAQGQSVVVSSGDGGVNDCGDGETLQVNGLAASPFVTGIGGTSLKVNFDKDGNATEYQGEQTWSGSGGGISLFFPTPDYQTAVGIPATGRAVPDVALLANPSQPGFFYIRDGLLSIVGGTSTSAPVWAGVLALTNQASKSKGLGNANPRIYSLGQQQQMSASPLPGFFNDVTTGTNSAGGLTGYNAKEGHDLCTGWGSPNVDRFARAFGTVPDRQSGLFLVFPNGSELLEKDTPITVRWQLFDDLAAKGLSQDVLFSTDQGKTFKPVATNLAMSARSFDFTANTITTTARFRISVRTASGDVIDTSDADINIGTKIRVDFARYSFINTRLEILGENLDAKAKLFVNGTRIDRPAKKLPTGELTFKGKEKKLKLKDGANLIVLEIDGVRTPPYKIFL